MALRRGGDGRRDGTGCRDKDGPLDKHHVVPRSRLRNKQCVLWNVLFHQWWHALFMNMTMAEVVRGVELVMTEPPPITAFHSVWGWKHWTSLRNRLIRETDAALASKKSAPHVWRPTSYTDIYRPEHNVRIDLSRVSEGFAEMWRLLFGDIPTLWGVADFIEEITVIDGQFPWKTLRELRARHERPLDVVVARSA